MTQGMQNRSPGQRQTATKSASPEHCRGCVNENHCQAKQELLVVSFGEGSCSECRKGICGIEGALKSAFPEWIVRRAFTSRGMIRRMADRDGVDVDSVPQAMERAVRSGVKVLTIQPTHMDFGEEYHDLIHELVRHYDEYDEITLAQPLLSTNEDFRSVANILVRVLSEEVPPDTAVCLVGSGGGRFPENTP